METPPRTRLDEEATVNNSPTHGSPRVPVTPTAPQKQTLLARALGKGNCDELLDVLQDDPLAGMRAPAQAFEQLRRPGACLAKMSELLLEYGVSPEILVEFLSQEDCQPSLVELFIRHGIPGEEFAKLLDLEQEFEASKLLRNCRIQSQGGAEDVFGIHHVPEELREELCRHLVPAYLLSG